MPFTRTSTKHIQIQRHLIHFWSPKHTREETGSQCHFKFSTGNRLFKGMCAFEKHNQSFHVTSHGESVLFSQANLSERRHGVELSTQTERTFSFPRDCWIPNPPLSRLCLALIAYGGRKTLLATLRSLTERKPSNSTAPPSRYKHGTPSSPSPRPFRSMYVHSFLEYINTYHTRPCFMFAFIQSSTQTTIFLFALVGT